MKRLLATVALAVPALAAAQTPLIPSKVATPVSRHSHIYQTQKPLFLGSTKDTASGVGCVSSLTTIKSGQFVLATADDDEHWVRIANVLFTPKGPVPIYPNAGPDSSFFTWKEGLALLPYELVTTPAKRRRERPH